MNRYNQKIGLLKNRLVRFVVLVCACLILVSVFFLGCSDTDSWENSVYIRNLYSWNGTGWQHVGFSSGNLTIEVDPVFTIASGGLATLTGGQELTNKTLTASVGKGTWTTSGTWTLPAFTQGGDIITNNKTFDAGSGYTNFLTTGSQRGLSFVCSNNGIVGGTWQVIHNTFSPDVGDTIFLLDVYSRNSDIALKTYVQEQFYMIDPTAGSEDAEIHWNIIRAGTLTQAMALTSTGVLYIDGTYQTYDDKDDAMLLKMGISDNNTQVLIDAGIMKNKIDNKGKVIIGEYDLNVQAILKLLAGAAYQNRDKIDVIEKRILALEAKIK